MTIARRSLPPLLLAAGLAAAATAPAATAAELKLSCAGKGPRNKDSAGTVLCAAAPGKARKVAGAIRNDAGQPVAAKLTVVYKSWTQAPNGVGYVVKPRATREISAGADGTFSISSSPATRESIEVSAAADPTLGIAAGASAAAEVRRRLVTTVKKLGGGTVKLTVKGTALRPLKLWVLNESGYPLPGVKPKQANRKGSATFDVGSQRGKLATYAEVGAKGGLTDLFWYDVRKTFRL